MLFSHLAVLNYAVFYFISYWQDLSVLPYYGKCFSMMTLLLRKSAFQVSLHLFWSHMQNIVFGTHNGWSCIQVSPLWQQEGLVKRRFCYQELGGESSQSRRVSRRVKTKTDVWSSKVSLGKKMHLSLCLRHNGLNKKDNKTLSSSIKSQNPSFRRKDTTRKVWQSDSLISDTYICVLLDGGFGEDIDTFDPQPVLAPAESREKQADAPSYLDAGPYQKNVLSLGYRLKEGSARKFKYH